MSTESRAPAAAPQAGVDERWAGVRRHWALARPWVSTAARILLGAVWIAAGAGKVTDLAASVRAVRAYQVLPEWAVPAVGAGLPFLEVALGVLLIVGLGVRLGAAVSAALFAVFIAGIVSASVRGLRIDCGCFGGGGELGAGQQTKYTAEIVRDVGLVGLAALVTWLSRGRFSVDGWISGPDRPANEHTHEGDA